MSSPLAPFSCSYTPNVPELLHQLNCTLVISTYQAGKVIFISAKNEEHLVQLPRTFNHAMGIALSGNKMAVATKDEVIVLANAKGLARSYPKQPNLYDALFMPRATYYTGLVDMHDLHWGEAGLWAVNTSFSCLSLINESYSWEPKWQPFFINDLVSEDRCHLNGLAMQKGQPKYVSALGQGNEFQSWRNTLPNGGILLDVESNSLILEQLQMPHSPNIFDGELYMLLSAKGELIKVDVENRSYETIYKHTGFVRGMAKHGEFLFIGCSRLRQNSSTFKDLEIAPLAKKAGIIIVHLKTGALVGEIKYEATVDEIYDVQVLPDIKRAGILNTQTDLHKYGLSIPNATYWGKM